MGLGIEAQDRVRKGEPAKRSGREDELGRAAALLEGPARLVTFTGPGGVGKSWTARELVHRVEVAHGWTCATVQVGSARDGTELLGVVAQALGLPVPAAAVRDRIARALAGRPVLLLLDGCEPLVGTPHPVAELLRLSPTLRVLATSLRPLQVEGEHVIGLDPFRVPGPGARPEELRDSAAVRLFCRTASRSSPRFASDDSDLAAVAELCRRVHGLPLAIELMASRAGEQSPAAMLRFLDEGYQFTYEHSHFGEEARHASLAAALSWSYGMLHPASARLLRRMSVFAAPATLDLLAGVVPEEHGSPGHLVDCVSELVDGRLVEVDVSNGQPAFSLVELVRDFAAERLVEEGEQARAEDAHTRAVVRFVLDRGPGVERSEDDVTQRQLARAEEDLRRVLRRLLGRGETRVGLQLAVSAAPFVLRRGYDGFVRHALAVLLRRAGSDVVEPALVARGHLWLGRLMAHFDGPEAAGEVRAALREGMRLARHSGDDETLLLGLAFQVQTLPVTRDLAAAAVAAAEGVPLAESVGDRCWKARFYAWAGMVANQLGRVEEAFDLALRGVRTVESERDERAEILLVLLLAGLPQDRAAPLMSRLPPIEDLLVAARRLEDARFEPFLLRTAAGLALRDGDLPQAAARCAECLHMAHRRTSWEVLPFALLLLAVVAAENGDPAEAARFYGMVRSRVEALRPAAPRDWMDSSLARLDDVRRRLGDEEFEVRMRQGERDMHLTALGEVIRYAERVAGHREAGASRPTLQLPGPDHLTPRELEVLEELTTGATNKEISRRLGMAPKTVMHHSMAVYRKLGVRGRAEATAWAFRNGLAD